MPKTAQKLRVVLKAEVDSETARRFAATCAETGVSQIAITSRLVQWFCRQDEQTQMSVLGMLGEEGKASAARTYLERVAREGQQAV